jgi:PAS domain S-box-containing protein
MPNDNLSQNLPSLASIVDRQPLIVAPDLPLVEVISLMSQAKGHTCWLPDSARASSEARSPALEISAAARHSAVLVLADNLLVGIFTERDLVKLTASQTDLHTVTIGDVMTTDPQTLVLSENHTVMTALGIFQQHQIRHLPILNDRQELLGIVTPEHIRQILQPVNLLRFRSIAEEMTTEVIQATPTTTILEIAQMMVDCQIGSIVIVDGDEPLRPVGIITERDIVQFQAFELELDQLLAPAVMSSPLFCLQPTDSLWAAQQIMQAKNIRRLVITNERGELAGILTQSNLLQLLDPLEMLYMVESLQSQSIDRAIELERLNGELQAEVAIREQVEAQLRRASQTLEERVVTRTAELALLTEELQVKIAEQESIEIALEVSQQGISDFIENAKIGMHWVDIEGNIVWANQAELDLLGYDRSEYIGQPLINFHVDRAKIADIFGQLLNDRVITGLVAQMRRKDGSICDVSIDSNAFFKNGKFIHARCFTRDISAQQAALRELQRSEASLQASEARYLALLTTAPVGIYQTDTAGDCIFINQQCLELLGLTRAEALGQGWANSLHPDDRVRVSTEWYGAMQAQQEYRSEHRFVTPQGRVNWVFVKAIGIYDESGTMTGYIGTLTDITERQAALCERKAAAQKIQEQAALLDIATDAIIVRDLDSQIQFWNNGAESIYGWTAAEAIGIRAERLFCPDIPLEAVGAFNTVQQKGAWQGELHKVTKTGKEVIVESRWTLVRDEAGNPRSILSVDTDITEKKSLEQQFLRAQRLESLGSLASGIAHDLNNVLTPIVGAAQLLPLTLPNLDDRNRRLLNMLVESSQRGSGLVKQILTFARGMDGERTVLQVQHILAEIISVARQTFPKSIEIQVNYPSEELWMVSVDATQIHQVLMNLFVNARDAMPNGGSLRASAENIVIDADRRAQLQPPLGAYILITIADTGIGMTGAILDRIFDPFFTTKETGTGLGLSTVQGIVKAHGGAIEVESEVGRGTCFKIYLPALYIKEVESPSTTENLYDGKGRLVLVVDDETTIREITKESLETYNYRVMLASDGIEAIDIYAQNYPSIAIVLVDMMMPHLDTRSIILTLQQINPEVQIVVMSGSYLDLESIVDKQQVSAVLTKPFTTAEMLQTLAEI